MRNGWIKLHTKTLDNPIFIKDPTAFRVFIYLLLRAYDDKSQPLGKTSTTRQQIADALSINNNTVYSALKRLKSAKMITNSTTTNFTTISICNWASYQSPEQQPRQQSINNVSTIHQQSYKNKDIRTNTTKVVFGKPEINELFNYWQEKTGIPITSQTKANRYAASSLLKQHGDDKMRRLIDGVVLAQADKYAPRISSFVQLRAKLPDLLVWGKQQSSKKIRSL